MFSLIELLVTLSILAALLSLLFPQLRKMRDHGHLIGCKQNLRSVNTAVSLHLDDNNDIAPGPLWIQQSPITYKGMLSRILEPYLDDLQPASSESGTAHVKEFMCPSYSSETTDVLPEYRVYFRTHFTQSGSLFGKKAQKTQPTSIHDFPDWATLGYLRDYSQHRMPKWLKKKVGGKVSEFPSHYGTDVNILSLDGRVTTKLFIE